MRLFRFQLGCLFLSMLIMSDSVAGVIVIANARKGRTCKAYHDPTDPTLMPHQMKNEYIAWDPYSINIKDSVNPMVHAKYEAQESYERLFFDPNPVKDSFQATVVGSSPTEFKLPTVNGKPGNGRMNNSFFVPKEGEAGSRSILNNDFFKNQDLFNPHPGRNGTSEYSRLHTKVSKMEEAVAARGNGDFLVALATYSQRILNDGTVEIDPEAIPMTFYVCPKEETELKEDDLFSPEDKSGGAWQKRILRHNGFFEGEKIEKIIDDLKPKADSIDK